MKLRTKIVQWGEICVEVSELNARQSMEVTQQYLTITKAVLGKDSDLGSLPLLFDWYLFLITQTTRAENLGFAWPNGEASNKEYKAAYEALQELPIGLVRAWREAIRELDNPPIGDPELAPPDILTEGQKKASE